MFSVKTVLTFVLMNQIVNGVRKYDKNDMIKLREEVRDMFQHAYNGYLTHASDYDELRPLSCDGVNTWGSYSLTLIDALDTLAVMGNYSEFRRVVDILTQKANFDSNINVSVFETNIRIVGGLLSAHLMSFRAGITVEPGWPCNGPLLRLAEDVAKRLLPAFDTPTGMPYGTVNLRYGIPDGETSVTCTAGVGTFIVEFGALSRLTGDPIYEEVALNALHSLYKYRSPIGLFGNHIDVLTGRWTAQDAGIGAGVDSYYEYLVKGAIMLQRPELIQMFHEGRRAIDKHLRKDDWHVWVSMSKGQITLPVFQSLEAYWPGVLSLIGDTTAAMKSLHNYHTVWKQYGFTPEFYNIPSGEAGANRENYPLRPELIESVMYLYRATGDPYLLQVGEDILRSIEHSAKTPCGYATIKDVRTHTREDRMESFFLAETTKYLYMLFDTDNFLHNRGQHGRVIGTPHGDCIIDTGGYIFNTEAHPIDLAALHCCHDVPQQELLKDFQENLKMFRSNAFNTNVKQKSSTPPSDTSTDEPADTTSENTSTNLDNTNKETGSTDTNMDDIVSDAVTNLPVYKIDSVDQIQKQKYRKTQKLTLTKTQNIFGESVDVVRLTPDGEDDNQIKEKISTESNFMPFEEILNSTPQTTTVDTDSVLTYKSTDLDKELFREDVTKNESKNTISSENNSMLTDFVQSLLKSSVPPRRKFDAQVLLERIQREQSARNVTWESEYSLLTCRAQPFLQRLSLLGEFF